MKKIAWCALLVSFMHTSLYAATYDGLTPGVSTRQDAERVFGKPVKEVIPGKRYDYSGENHDASRISVVFDPASQIIQSISLYFKESYGRADFKKWFTLGEPLKNEIDEAGNLVEYYQDVVLHYDGPDTKQRVAYITHFATLRVSEFGKETQSTEEVLAQQKKSYLGVNIAATAQGILVYSVAPQSPAEQAGLSVGDIILEVGRDKFYGRPVSNYDFVSVISGLPAYTPITFLVERQNKKIYLTVNLREADTAHTKGLDAGELFHLADKNIKEKQDYQTAIDFLEEAIRLAPSNWMYYNELGYAYYHHGQSEKAFQVLERSAQIAPSYFSSYLIGRILVQRNDFDRAMFFLNQAVRIGAPDVKDIAAREWLGCAYLSKGMDSLALDVFLKAHQLAPQEPEPLYFLGFCYDRMRNAREAMVYYKKYLDMRPNDATKVSAARERLKVVSTESGRQASAVMSESLMKIYGTVMQEMQKSR